MNQFTCLLIITSLVVISPVSIAKKRCKLLLDKLHNVQTLQRNGYSSSRGASLRAREDNARDEWWQCENGSRKNSERKENKVHVDRTKPTTNKVNNRKKKTIKAGAPFETNNAIVIKSKYEGGKKQAWLKYYQQPAKCQRPKSLPEFALCNENKQVQRIAFEKQYHY